MHPIRYANLSGDAGVTQYALGDGFIAVQFRGPEVYVYDATTPGALHVAEMTARAVAGRGLSTYINRHVRAAYARKQSSW